MTAKTPKFSFVTKRTPSVSIPLEKHIAEYLETKRIAKRSPKTILAYAQSLDQFRKWHDEHGKPDITTDLLREYIAYLSFEKVRWDDHPTSPNGEIGLSPRTVNNIIRNMRVFFNYLVRERIIKESPMNAVDYQTEEKETFETFVDTDVIKLLGAPNRRVYTGLRDYCLMLVLCDCGFRVSELTSLKVSDVDFKLRQITVRAEFSKTKTTRVAPISQKTTKELENLVSFINVEQDDYLWLTQFGERYFGGSFAKMLKLYAKRAGVDGPRVSPHTFRHYFAIKFLREGGDLVALSRILGHTSLNVTQIYLKYASKDLHDQHDKASPVASLLDAGNEKKRGKLKFR
ncbi:tyrosine-type recombinase/integrase [Paenibacillus polymyxa]|uniref:tyrosine-type recombinase/integrase n=1 Tax=Paenibacillus polymyxa TaxID=1406 RepID=UPI0005EC76B1|nr:tyrosine-type recombinase/integrase [Paenibacillus polymyxa]KJK28416.1 integrase [Paenibacillus polymyxa]